MSRKGRWKFTTGIRPHQVTVEEREPGGPLYVRAWDPTLWGGKGAWARRSLGHRDRERAKTYALKQAAKLQQGTSAILDEKNKLATVFVAYQAHRTPRKTLRERRTDARRIEMWTRVLGGTKDPEKVSLGEWERFIDDRSSGKIDPRGHRVPEANRGRVGTRVVEADLKWLKWVFNWASKWRTTKGRYLMRENPVRGFDIPTELDPKRPVATQDRFEAIRAKAESHTMEIRWNHKREIRQSYLAELLDIVNGTGRRISAVCQLRYEDLKLSDGRYGTIRWPAATDKQRRETLVPINPQVRAAVDRILRDRPGIGSAPLFPKPTDPTKPITIHLASNWLRDAEEMAGLMTQKGTLWHAYRRKWATERKHLPDVDVAMAGGWKSTECLKTAYQQADQGTMFEVVMGAGELREAR